jgi:prepilin-type processing-associated H-X9-DG protein
MHAAFVIARDVNEGKKLDSGDGRANNPNLWDTALGESSTQPGCRTFVSSFGSYHPNGTCNYLFGDGSVHKLSPNISFANVHWPLSHVSDGKAAELP